MSLPLLAIPTYEVKLVGLPKPVTYRPYLVKEEKILLMAQQGNDPKEVERAVKQIVRACTFDAVNPDTLASFNLEYLFLLLRSKSVNNVVNLRYECKAAREGTHDGLCHTLVPIDVNLDDVKITVPEGHTNRIALTPEIGVTFRYPTAEEYDRMVASTDIAPIIAACMETVYTSVGDVTEVREQDPDAVQAFVDNLTITQVDAIRQFFDTMPSLSHTVTFSCPKCGYTEDIVLSGLADFFD